jgi:LysR family hydrogen peroxide-inducible transcriptional activator
VPTPLDVTVLADREVLLLDDGHCLRDQALSVCALVGASERRGFRATSLETLRQMVAAGVGITLLPRLSVTEPVVNPTGVEILELAAPVPSREISMFWRPTSPSSALLEEIASVIREHVGPSVKLIGAQ